MAKSIMQSEKVCYVTGDDYNLHKHHIFGGACRKLSEKYGLTVWLRADWHNMESYGVHFNRELDMRIKRAGQREFEKTHSREEFMRIFGRNYIYDDEPAEGEDEPERESEMPLSLFITIEAEELPYGL